MERWPDPGRIEGIGLVSLAAQPLRIKSAQVVLLGVVATDVASARGYESYHPKYFTSDGNGSNEPSRLRMLLKRESNGAAPVEDERSPEHTPD